LTTVLAVIGIVALVVAAVVVAAAIALWRWSKKPENH